MVRPIPVLTLLGLCLALVCFPVECQEEVFTLTVSPEQSMAGLCPQRITFTCTTRNVTMLGTAIRWYFNNDDTVQNEFVYVRGQTYPHTIMGNAFTVVVKSASLSSDSSSVNAEVTLQIDASTLVAMGITSVQCGRTLSTQIRGVNVSSQLDNMEAPSLSQLNLNATYMDDGGLETVNVSVSSQQFYNLSNCDYKQNTTISVTSQDGDTVNDCEVIDAMSASCNFSMLSNSTEVTVQITATNSLGLSSSVSYPIPTMSFISMSIAFNDSSCNISIECLNVSSQSRLDRCELFYSTSDSYVDMLTRTGYAMFNVTGNKTYFFSAIYKDEVTTILHSNFTTGSCASSGASEPSNIIIIAIVVPVVVVVLVIVALVVVLIVFCIKRGKGILKFGSKKRQMPHYDEVEPPEYEEMKPPGGTQKYEEMKPSGETQKSTYEAVNPSGETNEEEFAQTLEQKIGELEDQEKNKENDVEQPSL